MLSPTPRSKRSSGSPLSDRLYTCGAAPRDKGDDHDHIQVSADIITSLVSYLSDPQR
jgi:hypothetical protein